jgi:hypothetical protein
VSWICGRPVEEEKRARRGVEGREKCGALERVDAWGVGVKLPLRRRPLAWAEGGRAVSWDIKDEIRDRRTWTMTFWCAESTAESLDECFACCDDLFVRWERHVGSFDWKSDDTGG